MPRPRLLTDEQEDAALAAFIAAAGKRGAAAALARQYGVSPPGMAAILERAKAHRVCEVSRETSEADPA